MRKTLILAIVLAAIAVIGAAAWFLFFKPSATPEETVTPVATSTLPVTEIPITEDQPGRINIPAKRGTVSVHNFLGESPAYGSTYVIAENPHFDIAYQRQIGNFLVTLYPDTAQQVSAYRTEATDQLATLLDLPKERLCDLRADVSVPDSYAAAFGNIGLSDLGLAGCANAIQ